MADKDVVLWVAVGVGSAPIWGTVLWELWQGSIRPCLLSRVDVEKLTTELIARYGEEADRIAFGEEHRAWRACKILLDCYEAKAGIEALLRALLGA
jgi:hypothetical protein